jgi:hypothetical protein
MLTLVTQLPDRRDLPAINCVGHDYLQGLGGVGDAVLVEPVFHDFRIAGDNELGFAFIAASALKGFKRLSIALTYTAGNTTVWKGYVQELRDQLAQSFPHTSVMHIPYVTCGLPMGGSVLAVTGSQEPWKPQSVDTVVMPDQYIPDLLAHVTRNRPNYPIMVSSRGIGAVRSDRNLLPPVYMWGGKSLFVEYKEGRTTKLRRMKMEDVGKIFGVTPCQYTDDLSRILPGEVVRAFA